jgi:hypothetical protein
VAIVAAQAGDANWNAVSATREFEVLPAFALSADQINVRENGEGRFFVRLNGAPASNVVVSVARVGGDGDLRVKSGASLAFGPANWDWWQAVTLAATNDDDKAGGTATFRVSLPGSEPRMVAAMEWTTTSAKTSPRDKRRDDIGRAESWGGGGRSTAPEFRQLLGPCSDRQPPGALTLALKAPRTVLAHPGAELELAVSGAASLSDRISLDGHELDGARRCKRDGPPRWDTGRFPSRRPVTAPDGVGEFGHRWCAFRDGK